MNGSAVRRHLGDEAENAVLRELVGRITKFGQLSEVRITDQGIPVDPEMYGCLWCGSEQPTDGLDGSMTNLRRPHGDACPWPELEAEAKAIAEEG